MYPFSVFMRDKKESKVWMMQHEVILFANPEKWDRTFWVSLSNINLFQGGTDDRSLVLKEEIKDLVLVDKETGHSPKIDKLGLEKCTSFVAVEKWAMIIVLQNESIGKQNMAQTW